MKDITYSKINKLLLVDSYQRIVIIASQEALELKSYPFLFLGRTRGVTNRSKQQQNSKATAAAATATITTTTTTTTNKLPQDFKKPPAPLTRKKVSLI